MQRFLFCCVIFVLADVAPPAVSGPKSPASASAAPPSPSTSAISITPVPAQDRAKIPPQSHRPPTLPQVTLSGCPTTVNPVPLSPVEIGTTSENVYRNVALGITLEFPLRWKVLTPQSLHAFNLCEQAREKTGNPNHPTAPNDVSTVPGTKLVFFTSPSGRISDWRFDVPALEIFASRSQHDSLDLNSFTQLTEKLAAGGHWALTSPPYEFMVNGHKLLRADFKIPPGEPGIIYHSYIKTLTRDYLLTIEWFASSPAELQQLTSTLQSISISQAEESP